MIVGRPIVYTGNGTAGTNGTQYPGVCVSSNSPSCTTADISVPGVGTLYGVLQFNGGTNVPNTGPPPGQFLWTGAW